jgi:S-adenosylmethionine hydrolase
MNYWLTVRAAYEIKSFTMQIVTLTTDFGVQDYFVGTVKGALLSACERLNIVDISHNIKSYDIVQAAFTLRNCYTSFPQGTIHVIGVNSFYAPNPIFVAVRHRGHYFIGPDNGLFSLIFPETYLEAVRLEVSFEGDFPLKMVFSKAVAHLANGGDFLGLGQPGQVLTQRINFQPITSASQIKGAVVHIDNYDNAILNVSRELFNKIGRGRLFELYFRRHDPITVLGRHYHDVPIGEPLCLFNSADLLEIAINMGQAASLLGLQVDDSVQIDFL